MRKPHLTILLLAAFLLSGCSDDPILTKSGPPVAPAYKLTDAEVAAGTSTKYGMITPKIYADNLVASGDDMGDVDTLAELNTAIADATILDDGAIADSTAIGLNNGGTYSNFGAAGDDSLNELFAAADTALGLAAGDDMGDVDTVAEILAATTDMGDYVTTLLADAVDDEAGFKQAVNLEIGTDVLAQQTIGVAEDNLLEVDDAGASAHDVAVFTANGIKGIDLTASMIMVTDSDGAPASGGVTTGELAELETIGATTISANQWAGLGGATTAGMALWDDAANTNQLVTLGLTATASEINTPLDGATVTLTEFKELETIGDTTISADQWGYVGGADQALKTTDTPTFAGVNITASADPMWEFNDSDAEGADSADEEAAQIHANMGTTTEDAEDSDFWITVMQAGSQTEVLRFDESDDQLESTKDITTTGTVTGGTITDGTFSVSSGAVTGATTIAAGTSVSAPLFDAPGDEDLDIGSADVDDVTLITENGSFVFGSAIDIADVNITSGADIAADSVSPDAATLEIGDSDEETHIQADGSPDSDDTYSCGMVVYLTAGNAVKQWDLVMMMDDGKVDMANATGIPIGFAVEETNDGWPAADTESIGVCLIGSGGVIRNDGWTGHTAGEIVFTVDAGGTDGLFDPDDEIDLEDGDYWTAVGVMLEEDVIIFPVPAWATDDGD
jgi:hypothetical protein